VTARDGPRTRQRRAPQGPATHQTNPTAPSIAQPTDATARPPVRLVRLPSGDVAVDNVPRTALQTLGALGGARYDGERRVWVVAAAWAGAIRGWARRRGLDVVEEDGEGA